MADTETVFDELIKAMSLIPDELGDETLANIVAHVPELSGCEAEIRNMLLGVRELYLSTRVAENLRNVEPSTLIEMNALEDEGEYHGDYRRPEISQGEWSSLFAKGAGRPPHDALADVWRYLGGWWDGLPAPAAGKRRNVWRPTFDKRTERSKLSSQAWLFHHVARLLHRAYTMENCSSVCDRMKELRRSPESRARRKESTAARAKKHKGKAKSGNNPPSS